MTESHTSLRRCYAKLRTARWRTVLRRSSWKRGTALEERYSTRRRSSSSSGIHAVLAVVCCILQFGLSSLELFYRSPHRESPVFLRRESTADLVFGQSSGDESRAFPDELTALFPTSLFFRRAFLCRGAILSQEDSSVHCLIVVHELPRIAPGDRTKIMSGGHPRNDLGPDSRRIFSQRT